MADHQEVHVHVYVHVHANVTGYATISPPYYKMGGANFSKESGLLHPSLRAGTSSSVGLSRMILPTNVVILIYIYFIVTHYCYYTAIKIILSYFRYIIFTSYL